MRVKNFSISVLVPLLISVVGCAPATVRSELYFGLSRHNAADISPAEWQAFVDQVITPRFPDGLTVLAGDGQWRGEDGTVAKEHSKVVIIVHPGTPDESRKLDEIREAYKKQFSQEAVLEVDESAAMKL